MTLEDDSWLEGRPAAADAVTIPVHGLTKRELAAAFNVPLKAIDKWTREGLPCRSTGSNRGGLRFDLPVAIEWRAAQREAEAAGDTTGTLADAKRRIALAQARRIELENAKEEGRLLQTETVSRYCKARYFAFRARFVLPPCCLNDMQRKELKKLDSRDERDDWEFALALMKSTDNPAMIEKIATILTGKSVNH
jgi:hypothetical protein